MIGEVIKVIKDKNERYTYKRLIFKMSDGSWAKTDIVKGFRNERRWKPFMKPGKVVCNLRMLTPDKVDADSLPYEWHPPLSDQDLARLGVFG